MRAYAAITMQLLMKAGYGRKESGKIAANHLVKRNVATDGRRIVSGRTVESWRDQCKAEKATRFCQLIWSAANFDRYIFPTSDRRQLQKDLLNRLDEMLLALRANDKN
jgi:hypothetical protein